MVLTRLKSFSSVHWHAREGVPEFSQNVQSFFGYDGLIYANQRRKELLDQKIEALEIELVRLKKLRRKLY